MPTRRRIFTHPKAPSRRCLRKAVRAGESTAPPLQKTLDALKVSASGEPHRRHGGRALPGPAARAAHGAKGAHCPSIQPAHLPLLLRRDGGRERVRPTPYAYLTPRTPGCHEPCRTVSALSSLQPSRGLARGRVAWRDPGPRGRGAAGIHLYQERLAIKPYAVDR